MNFVQGETAAAEAPKPLKQKCKFSPDEDSRLTSLVNKFGEDNWHFITLHMPGRNIRQCRERWRHYLSPAVSNAPWSPYEDYILDQKYSEFGPKWKKIAEFIPNRTDINIKNRWLLKQRRFGRISTQLREIVNPLHKEIAPIINVQQESTSQSSTNEEEKESDTQIDSFIDNEPFSDCFSLMDDMYNVNTYDNCLLFDYIE